MKNLSDFYQDEYLVESTDLPVDSKRSKKEKHQKYDFDEFDDGDFDLEESAGSDVPVDSNQAPIRGKKRKQRKDMKKESFNSLFDMYMEQDEMGMEDDYSGSGEYDNEYDNELDTEEEYDDDSSDTVEVSRSELEGIISTLQGLLGSGDFEENEYDDDSYDDFDDDSYDDDEVPMESWDGGAGDTGMKGDYSGKAKPLPKTTLLSGDNVNKGSARVGKKPRNTEGRTGSQELDGDYDGKAKPDKGTTFLSGGNSNKGSAKVNKKPNKGDLFG